MDTFDLDHYLENNAKALLQPLFADKPLSFEETFTKEPIKAPDTAVNKPRYFLET